MQPHAEFVHWLFATGILLVGMCLLAEAVVGKDVWQQRAWRRYLWPGIAFTMASWSAYITIYGVMIPVLSAGSNQDGVSATCTANVNWPGVLAWAGKVEAARPMAVRASTSRRDSSRSLPPRPEEAVIVFSLKDVESRMRRLTPPKVTR